MRGSPFGIAAFMATVFALGVTLGVVADSTREALAFTVGYCVVMMAIGVTFELIERRRARRSG